MSGAEAGHHHLTVAQDGDEHMVPGPDWCRHKELHIANGYRWVCTVSTDLCMYLVRPGKVMVFFILQIANAVGRWTA